MPYLGNASKFNRDTGLKVIGTVSTIVGDSPYDVPNLYQKSFMFRNNGPAPLAVGVIEISPDATNWATFIAIAGGTLGSASIWTGTALDTTRYLRFNAAVASGSVATVQAWINF